MTTRDFRTDYSRLLQGLVAEAVTYLSSKGTGRSAAEDRKLRADLAEATRMAALGSAGFGEVSARIVSAAAEHSRATKSRRRIRESAARFSRAFAAWTDGEIRLLFRAWPDGLPASAGWDGGSFRSGAAGELERAGHLRLDPAGGWTWTARAREALSFPSPPSPLDGTWPSGTKAFTAD